MNDLEREWLRLEIQAWGTVLSAGVFVTLSAVTLQDSLLFSTFTLVAAVIALSMAYGQLHDGVVRRLWQSAGLYERVDEVEDTVLAGESA